MESYTLSIKRVSKTSFVCQVQGYSRSCSENPVSKTDARSFRLLNRVTVVLAVLPVVITRIRHSLPASITVVNTACVIYTVESNPIFSLAPTLEEFERLLYRQIGHILSGARQKLPRRNSITKTKNWKNEYDNFG